MLADQLGQVLRRARDDPVADERPIVLEPPARVEAQGVQLPQIAKPLVWLVAHGDAARDANWALLRELRAATEFDYEISEEPVSLYHHYVAVYLDTTGGLLPECNEQDGR